MTLPVFETFEQAVAGGERLSALRETGLLMAWLSDPRNEPDVKTIKSIVWMAARRRWFDIAELLAAAAAGRFDATPSIRRLHTQMLMERGLSEEALTRLHALLANAELPEFDRAEAQGHIGRTYKDRFLAAIAARDEQEGRIHLAKSIEAYLTAYELDNLSVWHGINAAALLSRPEAAALRPDARRKAVEIAQKILTDAPKKPDEYTPATLAEAHIALGDSARALPEIRTYVSDPKVHPFQLATFHKQLTKLWMLDREPSPGPELVGMVAAALFERETGALVLSGAEVRREVARLEKVFGNDRFDSPESYRLGLQRSESVARIGTGTTRGDGTGFIVRGSDFCPSYGDRTVLVTNAHVISTEQRLLDQGALHPADALVTFEALPGADGQVFHPGAVLFSSPPDMLDVTIVELFDAPLPKASYPRAANLPGPDSEAPIRVIGHPSGGGLAFSVEKLLDHECPKIHYRTATEGGSSGSPVFNAQWKLIGLHHKGGESMERLNGKPGTYQANEGLWIEAICREASRTATAGA